MTQLGFPCCLCALAHVGLKIPSIHVSTMRSAILRLPVEVYASECSGPSIYFDLSVVFSSLLLFALVFLLDGAPSLKDWTLSFKSRLSFK